MTDETPTIDRCPTCSGPAMQREVYDTTPTGTHHLAYEAVGGSDRIILVEINRQLRDERDRYQRQAAWQRRQMSILRDELLSGEWGARVPVSYASDRLESIIHGAPNDVENGAADD